MKNQKNKIKQAEVHFEAIKRLFPGNTISLQIHGVDMDDLPKNWKVQENEGELSGKYKSAHRNELINDITLFD